jgi:uncharacterized protein (DUF4415 family)
MIHFTWDPEKSEANLEMRGFDFEFATLVFDGPRLEKKDFEGVIAVSETHTKKPSETRDVPVRGRADLPRLRQMSEEEVAATSPENLIDLPSDFWGDAELVWPQPKEAISLRVDQDVLTWFREGGPRYQTRMNAVLRSYMRAMERVGKGE